MKRLLIIFALFCYTATTYGQITAGLTASGFVNKIREVRATGAASFGGIGSRPSFSVGGFLQADHSAWLSTRLELNYTNTGYNSENENRGNPYTVSNSIFNYAQVSPMIGVRTKQGFNLFTGPTLNTFLGSSTRSRQITIDDQGLVTPTDKWFNGVNNLFDSFGSTKPFVMGWQVQLGYTHNRFSVHARRQWHVQPMGNLVSRGEKDTDLYYFRSWQYGLSYALFRSKGKQLKPNSL